MNADKHRPGDSSGMGVETVPTLTVASFNVRRDVPFGQGPRWSARCPAAARAIVDSGAAAIGVQELTAGMRADLQAALARLGGEYRIVGTGRGRSGAGEQTAILLRRDLLTPLNHKTLWLSRRPDTPGSRAVLAFFPRTVCFCEAVYRPWNRPVRFVNTHLDHMWESARLLGVRIILRELYKAARREPMPTVVLGDMNSLPLDTPIRLLTGLGRPLGAAEGPLLDTQAGQPEGTYHGYKRRSDWKTLDYIFASRDLNVAAARADRPASIMTAPSDHFLIAAELSPRR